MNGAGEHTKYGVGRSYLGSALTFRPKQDFLAFASGTCCGFARPLTAWEHDRTSHNAAAQTHNPSPSLRIVSFAGIAI